MFRGLKMFLNSMETGPRTGIEQQFVGLGSSIVVSKLGLGHGNSEKAVNERIQRCFFLVKRVMGVVGDQAVCASGFVIDGKLNMVTKSGKENIKERQRIC